MITEQSIKDDIIKIMNDRVKLTFSEEKDIADKLYDMFSKIYNADIIEARSKGVDEGYDLGSSMQSTTEELNASYEEGYERGYDNGYRHGSSEGFREGYSEGRENSAWEDD